MRRAGVSTRNFYEHFASREELLIALHDDLNARALEAVARAVAATDPDDLAAAPTPACARTSTS